MLGDPSYSPNVVLQIILWFIAATRVELAKQKLSNYHDLIVLDELPANITEKKPPSIGNINQFPKVITIQWSSQTVCSHSSRKLKMSQFGKKLKIKKNCKSAGPTLLNIRAYSLKHASAGACHPLY